LDSRYFSGGKTNLHTNSSKSLNNFITGVRSDLIGTDFNSSRSNPCKDEEEAIKTLILHQQKQLIIIKHSDKECCFKSSD
jgi:hypothetical protein